MLVKIVLEQEVALDSGHWAIGPYAQVCHTQLCTSSLFHASIFEFLQALLS